MDVYVATQDCYYIATSEGVTHYGFLSNGNEVITGLNDLEIFTSKAEYIDRLNELGIQIEEEN